MKIRAIRHARVLLSVNNCEHVYGISRSTLYRWLASGEIRGKKLGRSTYVVTQSLVQRINKLPDWSPTTMALALVAAE